MKTLLTLNIIPELEEDLVDYLLVQDGVEGFTSYEVRGHGRYDKLSPSEQVSGRVSRLRFELVIESARVESLLTGLGAEVGPDIVYWNQDVSNPGRT